MKLVLLIASIVIFALIVALLVVFPLLQLWGFKILRWRLR